MKRILYNILLTGLLIAGLLTGQVASAEEFGHNRVAFSGSLASWYTYSLELSYHYMFFDYIGVGGAVGNWKNWYEDGWASGTGWHIDSDDNEPSNLYLRPSLVLISPGIKYKDCTWSLFAEPSVMLNIPYQRVCINLTTNWPLIDYDYTSTNAGQWFAAELRAGINLRYGPCGISAGYLISNLNIYSQYRHLYYRGESFRDFYPNKPLIQGAFLSLSYQF